MICSLTTKTTRQKSMKLLLTKIKIYIISLIGYLIIKIIYLTSRETVFICERTAAYMADRDKPVIICFWHGHQMLMPGVLHELFDGHSKRKTYALISEHNDGRIIAGLIKYFDLDSIAGSSSRSAKRATMQMIKTLRGGDNIAITPDGPRGPIHKVKTGIIKVAQISGYPIVPMAVHASSHWQLKSWDKMIVPKPFAKLSFSIGEPIHIPREISKEEVEIKSTALEEILNKHSLTVRGVFDA